MEENTVKPLTARALAAFLGLLVLFSALATSVYAWSRYGRQSGANSEELSIDADNVAAMPFVAFKYDNDSTSDTYEKGIMVEGDDVSLPLYDSVFVEQNANAVLIYKVQLFGNTITSGEAFDITLEISPKDNYTDNDLYETVEISGNAPATMIADLISNVIYVKAAYIAGLQDDSNDDPDTIYHTAHTYFKDVSEQYQFLEYNTDGTPKTKRDKIVIHIDGDDYTPPTSGDEKQYIYLFIEIGYVDDLVKNLLDSRELQIGGDEIGKMEIEIAEDLGEFVFTKSSED